MKEKKWLMANLIVSVFLILPAVLLVMVFNFAIDPLWQFTHKNEWNDFQIGFDEREQKTNKVLASDRTVDGLLVGTSRLTYWDQWNFEENEVFNYSLSSMALEEYLPYIKFAEEQLPGDIAKVYMELYYGSFANNGVAHLPPETYLSDVPTRLDKFLNLYSVEVLKRAKENMEISATEEYAGPRYYDRENVGYTQMGNYNHALLMEKLWSTPLEEREPHKADFNYYENMISLIHEELEEKEIFPMSDVIPMGRLKYIWALKEDRENYEKWIRSTVEEFGAFYVFHKKNKYTVSGEYWLDLDHYYQVVADELVKAVENPEKYPDLVTKVTPENIEEFFKQLEQEIESYDLEIVIGSVE